jgi:hypothetical protein
MRHIWLLLAAVAIGCRTTHVPERIDARPQPAAPAIAPAAAHAPASVLAEAARPPEGTISIDRFHYEEHLKVREERPRIYLNDADLRLIKDAIARDPETRQLYERIRKLAEGYLVEPPPQYSTKQQELLTNARKVLSRVTTLALMYRIDGDARFAEQARREMLAACAFPDWMPDNFLPTAEMCNAMGVGYDWLFSYLNTDDRKTISDAITKKALEPALEAYESDDTWAKAQSNHNNVGNGGAVVGALTVADEQRGLTRRIVENSRRSIAFAMQLYAPDGGWPEGPMYWDYATRYTVFYLAALESAAGTDLGLKSMPGFSHTGFFRIHSTGPTRLTFNFGDADAILHPAPFMYWMARAFKQPIYAAHERWADREAATGYELVWAPLAPTEPFEAVADRTLARDALFRGVECAFFRGAWNDPDTTWLAIKGGQNHPRGTHAHLDLGSFVMDALGQRWACDLGPEDYDLPGYFREQRWNYYRCSTRGHNTIVLDNENQELLGHADVLAFRGNEDLPYAVVNLTHAWDIRPGSMLRGVFLIDRKHVLVQDDLNLPRARRVTWNFHTPAHVRLDGPRAVLEQNGRTLHARILAPAGARFDVLPGDPGAKYEPQDVRNLVIDLPHVEGKERIAVLLSPGDAEPPQVKLRDLAEWIESARP